MGTASEDRPFRRDSDGHKEAIESLEKDIANMSERERKELQEYLDDLPDDDD